MFNDKIILITGGTGTVGTALIEYLLSNYSVKTIRIFSRDETKQQLLRNTLKKYNQQLRFFIGDIRDKERLIRAMENVDIVFHLAALKHVLACEYNPFEAVKTNIIGLQNLIEVCIDKNIEKFVFTSTDKAATPCNTMGVTKLLAEKLVTAANYYKGGARTIFYSLRFGNVTGSRGSLIPLIENQVKKKIPITLTDKKMTRYIMSLDSAVNFIINSLKLAQGGEVFVMKMNCVRITDLIEVLFEYFNIQYNNGTEKIQIDEIGMFSGEKIYEELFSLEEAERTYEMDNMYLIIPQLTEISNKIDLKKYPAIMKFDKTKPYNSEDGPFLTKKEITEFLSKNNLIKECKDN